MSNVPELDAYDLHDREWDSYEELYDAFEWEVPEEFNVASYVCDRWADDKDNVAIFSETAEGERTTYTYWQLRNVANQLANYLAAAGVERGDRVGVNLPQKPETVITHVAIWKLGAVTVPLSTLFGPDGLGYRLDDCEAAACIVDESNVDAYREAREGMETSPVTLTVGDVDRANDEEDFWEAIEGQSREFDTVTTNAEDDAIITYTSGTTGDPKGVVHAHRVLLGLLPLFEVVFCDLELGERDVFWTPSEWAWMGTVFSMVVPAMYFGKPVLAYDDDGPFDAEAAFDLIDRYGVTVALLHPTVLRMMMQAESPTGRYELDQIRVVVSGGEDVGPTLLDWIDETFEGTALQEAFGQTEANGIVGECSLLELPEGTSGRALPGHEVAIVDPETAEPIDEPDTVGEIAVRYDGNPICMMEYWNLPEKTARKIRNGWLLTEDLGSLDEDGFLFYHSRKDDVIISSGRRIGPGEIEDSLAGHDAVLEAGVIGVPHDERGEVPKAFVTLAENAEPGPALTEELKQYVQDRLARYEYPHEIEFVDDLPKTTTGKVRRTDLRDWA